MSRRFRTPPFRALCARQMARREEIGFARERTYFVTMGAYDGQPAFGALHGDDLVLSPLGCIVQQIWRELPKHHPNIVCDAFSIRPDGVQFLIGIRRKVYTDGGVPAVCLLPTTSLSDVVQNFKARVALVANQRVWQRHYYEHTIRNPYELRVMRNFIELSPMIAR